MLLMKANFKKARCPWLNLKNKLYVDYHDQEWGRPVHDDHCLFEMITLEGAQAGLSWETVLNKREHYRKVFASFDPLKVSKFSQIKIEKLLLDSGIIRNRLKVESTISNAEAFFTIQKEFGSFDQYLWAFVNDKPIYNSFTKMADYPTKTNLSDKISKDLKKRGFRFVGSTIIYAFMQAVGITQDHAKDCYLHGKKFKSSK
jgi:DNA-3-methyladenine glycosylase I